jgi:hypothetical protein
MPDRTAAAAVPFRALASCWTSTIIIANPTKPPTMPSQLLPKQLAAAL